jgi:hypothetical protein
VTSPALDRERCPLCGERNDCGLAAGKGVCWCFTAAIPREVLERVPAEARGVACVCTACASGRRHPAKLFARIEALMRRH